MQKILLIVLCGFVMLSVGNATVVSCSTYTNNTTTSTEVNYIIAQGGCSIGGLTILAGGLAISGGDSGYSGATQGSSTVDAAGDFNLDLATIQGNVISVGFNPAQAFTADGVTDLHFVMEVLGGVQGSNLSVGTSGSIVSETQCENFMSLAGGPTSTNGCTAAQGTNPTLWNTSVTGVGSAPATGEFIYSQGAQSTVYEWKDLNAGSSGDLSQFNESFLVPEPVSLLLLGSGMVGLGLLRLRRKKS